MSTITLHHNVLIQFSCSEIHFTHEDKRFYYLKIHVFLQHQPLINPIFLASLRMLNHQYIFFILSSVFIHILGFSVCVTVFIPMSVKQPVKMNKLSQRGIFQYLLHNYYVGFHSPLSTPNSIFSFDVIAQTHLKLTSRMFTLHLHKQLTSRSNVHNSHST